MADEGTIQPRIDSIRPIQPVDRVTIPGPLNPAQLAQANRGVQPASAGPIRAIEIVRDQGLAGGAIMVGDRACAVGEILRVIGLEDRPRDPSGRTIRLTDDLMPAYLFEEQAVRLIRAGYARPTELPPTAGLGGSRKVPEGVEVATHPAHARAEKAVAPRQQGRGAI